MYRLLKNKIRSNIMKFSYELLQTTVTYTRPIVDIDSFRARVTRAAILRSDGCTGESPEHTIQQHADTLPSDAAADDVRGWGSGSSQARDSVEPSCGLQHRTTAFREVAKLEHQW